MDKSFLAILCVFLGWLLAQGTELLNKHILHKQLKKSLFEELIDLNEELLRGLSSLERKLQIYSLGGVENSVPLKMSNYFFKNHYNKIFHKLNREQRISYQLIHSHIEGINYGFDKLESSVSSDKEPIADHEKYLEDWGNQIKAQYKNIMNCIWHIDHHISNAKQPNLSLFSEAHESYINYQNEIDAKIGIIIEKAKQLNRNNFDQHQSSENATK